MRGTVVGPTDAQGSAGSGVRVNIAVSRELGIPLSTQVRDQIVAAISKGDLVPGDRLPTIRQLADFLDLNRNTIAQVYRALEQEGYLMTRGGGGPLSRIHPRPG